MEDFNRQTYFEGSYYWFKLGSGPVIAEHIYPSLKVVGFVRSGVGWVRICDLFLVTCEGSRV